MADQAGEKTEAPTPRRRLEAREQGNIPRSADLTSAVILLGMLMMLNFYGKGVVEALRSIMDRTLSIDSLGDLSAAHVTGGAVRSLMQAAGALAPILIAAMLLGIVINLAQVGLNFNTKKLQPNIAALNPLKGLGKLVKGEGFAKLIFSVLKLLLVTAVAWSAVSGRMGEIVASQNLDFLQIFMLGASLVYSIGIRIGVLLLILALLDYMYQRFRVEKELKMTKQEVKDEMKRMDGDPLMKQRRRQLALQMLQKRIAKDVPTADVIVTNPTHYSVALKYDSANMTAPRVVAKGQDFIALRIREIAVANGIPIVERPPLARSLYANVEVGQEIPENLYAAVAEILAYVYELSKKERVAG